MVRTSPDDFISSRIQFEREGFHFCFEVKDASAYRENFPAQIESRSLWTARQVHGDKMISVNSQTPLLEKPEADALWTEEAAHSVGVFVADCTALLVGGIHKGQRRVAAIHAGWRGTALGIIEKCLRELELDPGFWIWLSPSICGECYEVGEEVIQKIQPRSEQSVRSNSRGRFQLDLKTEQLKRLEAFPCHVLSSSLCTKEQPEFHSYRAMQGKLSARHLAWISF